MDVKQPWLLTSVIIPTRDRPHMLMRAIKSVICQTFKDLEIIIVNDGSEHIDEELLKKYFGFQGIRVLRNMRKPGAAGARNTGFYESSGKFIGFLDDDDEWLPRKIEKQVEAFQNSCERVGIIFTQHFIVKKNTKILKEWVAQGDVYQDLCREHIPGNTSNPLIKRNVLNEVGLWDEKLPADQDKDLWLRIAKRYHFATVREPLVLFYWHDFERISTNRYKKLLGELMFLKKHWKDLPIQRKCRVIKRIARLTLKIG